MLSPHERSSLGVSLAPTIAYEIRYALLIACALLYLAVFAHSPNVRARVLGRLWQAKQQYQLITAIQKKISPEQALYTYMEKGEFEGAAPQENPSHIFIRKCVRVGMVVCKECLVKFGSV